MARERVPSKAAPWIAGALVVGSAALATVASPVLGGPLLALSGVYVALFYWASRLGRAGEALQAASDQLLTAGRPAQALERLDAHTVWAPRWVRRHLAAVRGLALVRLGRAEEAAGLLAAVAARTRGLGRSELLGMSAYARARTGDAAGAVREAEAVLAEPEATVIARTWAALALVLARDAQGDHAETRRLLGEHGRLLLDTHLPEERRLLRRIIDRDLAPSESVYRVAPPEEGGRALEGEDEDLLAPVPGGIVAEPARKPAKARGQTGALLAVLGAVAATAVYALVRGAHTVERQWPEQAPGRTVGFEALSIEQLAPAFIVSLVCALGAWVLYVTNRRLVLADRLGDLTLRARSGHAPARDELKRLAAEEHASLAHAAALALSGVAIEEGRFDEAVTWADRVLALAGLPPRATADARTMRGLALACAGRLDEAEAEATAAGTELHTELRRYAIRLVVLLRRGELAAAARLVEAKAERLPLQERFEALGLLARLVTAPALLRAREHAWVLSTWEGEGQLRAWVEQVAPPLAAAVSELLVAPRLQPPSEPDADEEAEREARAEAEADAHDLAALAAR